MVEAQASQETTPPNNDGDVVSSLPRQRNELIRVVRQTLGDKSYALSNHVSHSGAEMIKFALLTPMASVLAVAQLCLSLFPSSWRNGFGRSCQTKAMIRVKQRFHQERLELLRDIGENDVVLDVGSGSGLNLEYIQHTHHIVALEPNTELHLQIQQTAQGLGIEDANITIVSDCLEEYASKETKKFDWIIVGNVLCEVPNVPAALQSIDVLLKPGGKVYFSEHIIHTHGSWKRWYQNVFNPIWRYGSGGGCNWNRDTLDVINQVMRHKWDVVSWKIRHDGVLWFLGLAGKKPLE